MMPSTLSELELQGRPALDDRGERDRLRLLGEVSESIASHRDLNELFRDLAQRLPRIVPFDYINLVLHDAARNVMRLQLLVAPVDSTIKAGAEFPVDGSPGGFVWKTQQPLDRQRHRARAPVPGGHSATASKTACSRSAPFP